MYQAVLTLIESEQGLPLIAVEGETVVGLLLVLVYHDHLTDEWIAGELAWWVDPDRRGIGLRMLRLAETWARQQGAQRLQVMAPSPEVERLYERLGYRPLERTYDRRL